MLTIVKRHGLEGGSPLKMNFFARGDSENFAPFFRFFRKIFFWRKKNRRRPADRHFIPGIQLFHFSHNIHVTKQAGKERGRSKKNAAYPQNKGFH
jgi:hypothetical protein